MLKELEKTANVISNEPWFMTDAAEYLREFASDNRCGTRGCGRLPPNIDWIWSKHADSELEMAPTNRISASSLLDSRGPQRVHVVGRRGSQTKRTAAKSTALGQSQTGRRAAGSGNDPVVVIDSSGR